MKIQLRWVDPKTGQEKKPKLDTPVIFGSDMAAMPSSLNGKAASRMVLDHEQVEPFHAVIEVVEDQLYINDQNSQSGTQVNRVAGTSHRLNTGNRIQIGPIEILVSLLSTASTPATPPPLPISAATPPPLPNSAAPLTGGSGDSSAVASYGLGNGVSIPGASLPEMGADGTCDKQVGFLIKRRCGRSTPEGCKFCRNGQVDPNRDLYRDDYKLYPDYGNYDRSCWGNDYYRNRDRYYYDSTNRRVDFTEADGASFEQESDQDYEMDLDAS